MIRVLPNRKPKRIITKTRPPQPAGLTTPYASTRIPEDRFDFNIAAHQYTLPKAPGGTLILSDVFKLQAVRAAALSQTVSYEGHLKNFLESVDSWKKPPNTEDPNALLLFYHFTAYVTCGLQMWEYMDYLASISRMLVDKDVLRKARGHLACTLSAVHMCNKNSASAHGVKTIIRGPMVCALALEEAIKRTKQ